MNIITCLATDILKNDKHVKYKTLGKLGGKAKQKIYWKLAFTYFNFSVRLNTNFNHILFTNDQEEVIERGFNYKKEISSLGVEIRYLPFKEYDIPAGGSALFKNAYYKFEVFRELGNEKDASIYTDLDCIWANRWDELTELAENYDLILYDVYDRNSNPLKQSPNSTSMKDMGDLFRKISSNYLTEYPIWYGGEIIAAKAGIFKELAKKISIIYKQAISEEFSNLRFPSGESLLDGDEYLSCYVYNNNNNWRIFNAKNQIKRIWTHYKFSNVDSEDMNLKIWHLPAEKISGFEILFNKISSKHSKFMQQNEFPQCLANYVGIKNEKLVIRSLRTFYYFANKLKGKFNFIISG